MPEATNSPPDDIALVKHQFNQAMAHNMAQISAGSNVTLELLRNNAQAGSVGYREANAMRVVTESGHAAVRDLKPVA
jgi:hypothetical protein